MPFAGETWVTGDALPFVEDFDHQTGDPDIDLLFNERIGNAVVGPADGDVVIDRSQACDPAHAGLRPIGENVGRWWQRSKRRTVDLLEHLAPRPSHLLKRTVV